MVVSSPMCPPLSPPSATTAAAPRFSTSFATPTEATTGTTLIPASNHAGIYLPGFPAPVVRTGTFSSTTTRATSSTKGLISITLTPKGLSVISRHLRISARSCSPLEFIPAIIPRPPAFETAEARDASATQAMPPWKIGYSMPNNSQIGVFIIKIAPFQISTQSFFIRSKPVYKRPSSGPRQRWKSQAHRPDGTLPRGASHPSELQHPQKRYFHSG